MEQIELSQYLQNRGAIISSYCNIPGHFPNVFFNKDGESCFAVIRSVPGGLRKEKYYVPASSQRRLNGLKGYFFDVLWGNMAWIVDDLEDTQLKRSDYPFFIDCHMNIKPIEEAINEWDFIEVVGNGAD